MPVVKINAIEVPPDAGPELEKRFAQPCTRRRQPARLPRLPAAAPGQGRGPLLRGHAVGVRRGVPGVGDAVPPSRRTPASAPTRWPPARHCSSSRLCWTLRGPTPRRRRGPGAPHAAAALTVAVALVAALACGCADTGPARRPTPRTAFTSTPTRPRVCGPSRPWTCSTPTGRSARRGPHPGRAADQVDDVGVTHGHDLVGPAVHRLTGVDIGAGQRHPARADVLRCRADIELRTNDDGLVDRFEVSLQTAGDQVVAGHRRRARPRRARATRIRSSKVDDGKCDTVAGTNTDLSLPLASIFKLYVLLAVADAVKAGTVRWNDQLTITKEGKARRLAGPRRAAARLHGVGARRPRSR